MVVKPNLDPFFFIKKWRYVDGNVRLPTSERLAMTFLFCKNGKWLSWHLVRVEWMPIVGSFYFFKEREVGGQLVHKKHGFSFSKGDTLLDTGITLRLPLANKLSMYSSASFWHDFCVWLGGRGDVVHSKPTSISGICRAQGGGAAKEHTSSSFAGLRAIWGLLSANAGLISQ